MPGTGPQLLINGCIASHLPALDRAIHYGDGVFETLAVHGGRPLLWERHMERLQRGCQRLGLPMPDAALLRAELESLCPREGRAVAKIILSRGAGGRGYAPPDAATATRVVSIWPWPDYPAQNARTGVAVRWCRTPVSISPHLAGIKHLNRLDQVLARAEWRNEYAEGLMCDPAGFVVEGTMSNLFAVSGDIIITPELSQSGVAGVMRAEIMDAAGELGLRVEEVRISAPELDRMDEIFLTNSIIGVWPVRVLATRSYDIGKVSQTLQRAIREAQCFETGA